MAERERSKHRKESPAAITILLTSLAIAAWTIGAYFFPPGQVEANQIFQQWSLKEPFSTIADSEFGQTYINEGAGGLSKKYLRVNLFFWWGWFKVHILKMENITDEFTRDLRRAAIVGIIVAGSLMLISAVWFHFFTREEDKK